MELPTLSPPQPAPTPAPRPDAGAAATDTPSADGANGGFAATLDRKLAEGRQDEAPAETTAAREGAAEMKQTPDEATPAAPADALLALLATPYAPAPVVAATSARSLPGEANTTPRAGAETARPVAAAGVTETARPLGPAATGGIAAAREPAPFMPSAEPHVDTQFELKQADAQRVPALAVPHETAAPLAVVTPTHGHPALTADFQIAAPPPVVAEREITARVGTNGWNDGLAQQVTLMVKDGEQIAQLRLDPPDLGPLEVHLSLDGGEQGVAHVQFVSAHAPVRDALEAALPQLRAALAGNGIMLGQATVGDQSARGEAQDAPRRAAGDRGGGRGDERLAPVGVTVRRSGLVDTFA